MSAIPTSPNFRFTLLRVFSLFIVLIFPALILYLVIGLGLDAPFWDQWDLVPLIEKFESGTLSLGDLWAQHNEHRPLVPRAIMLLLAKATGWNTRAEMVLGFVMACILLGFMALWLRNTAKDIDPVELYLMLPVISAFVFSFNQWENWFWGWQIQIHLCVLASIVSISLLSANPMSRFHFRLSVIAAIVATYSFSIGLLTWPLGMLMIGTSGQKEGKRRAALIWIAFAAVTCITYFIDFKGAPHHAQAYALFSDPLAFLHFLLVGLGAPVCGFDIRIAPWAGLWGILAFCLVAFLNWRLTRSFSESRQSIKLVVCWGLFGILSTAAIAAGRAGMGVEFALGSRYIIFSSFLWISIAILLLHLSATGRISPVNLGRLKRTMIALIMALMIAMTLYGWDDSLQAFREQWFRISSARAILMQADPPQEALEVLYADPEVVRERLKVLAQYRYSVFRPGFKPQTPQQLP